MSLINEQLSFSDIADTFLVHGSLQSPAFLDGRLAAGLALHDLSAEAWLAALCDALGVDQPRDQQNAQVLLDWRRQSLEALAGEALNYELLLPDEMFSLAERARGLQEWTQGFLEVLSDVDPERRAAWSAPLREALDDLASLVDIDTELEESSENENDLFALTEHVRMAAMLLYTEQHPGTPQVEQAKESH